LPTWKVLAKLKPFLTVDFLSCLKNLSWLDENERWSCVACHCYGNPNPGYHTMMILSKIILLFCICRYADLVTSLLHPHGRIMLEHHFYFEDPGPHQEPPSHIPEQMVYGFYGNNFDIEKLDCEIPSDILRREYRLMTSKQ